MLCRPRRVLHWLLPGLGLGTLAALAPGAAHAATLEVCSTCTYTTIQDAIDDASDGDTIDIAAGTWTEDLEISTELTLQGAGTSLTTIEKASDGDAAITVTADATLTDLSVITWAYKGVGILIDGTHLTLEDVNTKAGQGRGTCETAHPCLGSLVAYDAEVTLTRTVMTQTNLEGGHIYAEDTSITIEDSELTGARGVWNPVTINATGSGSETISISGTLIYDNEPTEEAGYADIYEVRSIYVKDYASFTLEDSIVALAGQAMYLMTVDTVTLLDNVVYNNCNSWMDTCMWIRDTGSVIGLRNHFCYNVSDGDSGPYIADFSDILWANNVHYADGFHAYPWSSSATGTIAHNYFYADNALGTSGSGIDFVNNVLEESEYVSLNTNNDYNLWIDISDTSDAGSNAVSATSGAMWSSTDYCEELSSLPSEVEDAGDPSILDLDGSRSDIGPWGGPYLESDGTADHACIGRRRWPTCRTPALSRVGRSLR